MTGHEDRPAGWLDSAARFYDLDLRGHEEDLDFWASLARHCGGPILDVGCGTGRVTAGLAATGLPVTAIDISPAMVERARRRLAPHQAAVQLLIADMRSFDLGRAFDLVCVPLAGFCHLASAAEQMSALTSFRRHMAHGALLALDLPFLEPELWAPGPRRLRREWRRKDEQGRWVSKWSAAEPDLSRHVQSIRYEYRVEGEQDTVHLQFELRYLFPGEVEHMFARAGLRVERIYGGYELQPFGRESSRMLVLGREETAR